mgnify:CR=1
NVVDFVDNTFLGDQRSKDEILQTRDQLTGQGVKDRVAQEENFKDNVVADIAGRSFIGARLGNLETAFELSELAG